MGDVELLTRYSYRGSFVSHSYGVAARRNEAAADDTARPDRTSGTGRSGIGRGESGTGKRLKSVFLS